MAPTPTQAIPVFILLDEDKDGYNIAHFYLKDKELSINIVNASESTISREV